MAAALAANPFRGESRTQVKPRTGVRCGVRATRWTTGDEGKPTVSVSLAKLSFSRSLTDAETGWQTKGHWSGWAARDAAEKVAECGGEL